MIYFFISLITYISYQILKTRKILIQLNKNNAKKILFTKNNFISPELLGIGLIIIAFICNSKITGICMIVLYMFLSLLEISKAKEKLKLNKHNIRIVLLTIAIYLLVFLLFVIDYKIVQKEFFMVDHSKYYYAITVIIGYFNYLIMYLTISFNKLFKK